MSRRQAVAAAVALVALARCGGEPADRHAGDRTPRITREEAIERAVQLADGYRPPNQTATLEVWHDPASDRQRLVWRVRLDGGLRPAVPGVPAEKAGLPGNYEALIDAVDGDVVSQASG